MLIHRVPPVVRPLAKQFIWKVNTPKKKVFITFDDGPIPEVTPKILDILDRYNARATFFCLGKNAALHPAILADIKQRFHTVGNHTWNHPNGWKTPVKQYLREVIQCDQVVKSRLFRPPYGRISRAQATALKSRYHLVMWDVISGDYDPNINAEKCLNKVIANTRPGSIIVFHDNLKARETVLEVLPKYLEFLQSSGYQALAIDAAELPQQITAFK